MNYGYCPMYKFKYSPKKSSIQLAQKAKRPCIEYLKATALKI